MSETDKPTQTSISVGVFLENNDKYLLLQRNDTDIWEFPKGHMEENENEFETISRELYEETGIKDAKIGKKIGSIIFDIDKGTFIKRRLINYYKANCEDLNVILSKEHKNYLWLDKDEILNHLQFEDIKNIFMKSLTN